MGERGKKRKKEALWANNQAYWLYFDRLKSLAVASFDWENVPEGVNIRYLEQRLFYEGRGIFFRDEIMEQFLSLGVEFSGNVDVYGEPVIRTASGHNGVNYYDLNPGNSVIVYNNLNKTPTLTIAQYYANKLWRISRAFDVNVSAQRTPVAIIADQKQRLTMLNFYQQYDGDEPFIFGDDSLDLTKIRAIKTDAPVVFLNLYQAFTNVYNEYLSVIGIPNVSVEKKERLIKDEVSRNLGGTLIAGYNRLDTRKEACERMNKLFGLNMDVRYRELGGERENVDVYD